MALSEKQMLILDCFTYSDIATKNNSFVNKHQPIALNDAISKYTVNGRVSEKLIREAVERKELNLSGDLDGHPERLVNILEEIRADKKLSSLKITYTTEEKYGKIRAACFYDSEADDVTVAFRGTGGSAEQWYNNFEGYGAYEQETQKAAREFIESLPQTPPYDQIDVTGHSSGGNQAMYVTITCGDRVRHCVSYEGQGISKQAYLDAKEKGLLDQNEYKIINISGRKDFVGILLLPIGDNKYVESTSSLLWGLLFFLSHGSYGLWEANKDLFDENGRFKDDAFVEQAWWCKDMHSFTVFLDEYSDMPIAGACLELFADFLGVIVGVAIDRKSFQLSAPESWKRWCETFQRLLQSVGEFQERIKADCKYLFDRFVEAVKYVYDAFQEWYKKSFDVGYRYAIDNPYIEINTGVLKQYSERLLTVNRRLNAIDKKMDTLYSKVGWRDLWTLMRADIQTKESRKLKKCIAYLDDTVRAFETVERELQKI